MEKVQKIVGIKNRLTGEYKPIEDCLCRGFVVYEFYGLDFGVKEEDCGMIVIDESKIYDLRIWEIIVADRIL